MAVKLNGSDDDQKIGRKKIPHSYKLYSYDNAGHTLNDGYMMGGTVEGNKNARLDSEQRILEFLDRTSN